MSMWQGRGCPAHPTKILAVRRLLNACRMAQPGTWGGEPELLMLSQHVLEIPLEAKGSAAGPAALLFSHAARSGVFSGGWAVQAPPDILPGTNCESLAAPLHPPLGTAGATGRGRSGPLPRPGALRSPAACVRPRCLTFTLFHPFFPGLSCGMAIRFIRPLDNTVSVIRLYRYYTPTASLEKTCRGVCKAPPMVGRLGAFQVSCSAS